MALPPAKDWPTRHRVSGHVTPDCDGALTRGLSAASPQRPSSERRVAPTLAPTGARPSPSSPPPSQMRGLLLVSLAAGALGATELTKATFQTAVKDSGKNAFVKFLAPW